MSMLPDNDEDDDLYTEEEPKLAELEPEDLIAIAEEEDIDSEHVEPLKVDIQERDQIQKQIDRSTESGQPVPQPVQDKLDEVTGRIDDRSRDLIDDIEAQRDEFSTPTYGPDEVSDDEGDEDGP